ncbi:hypothetical protein SK68_04984 [Serratia marcescens]|nr:hypothetical protein SK68_04984 [Serratia marcescens]KMJ03314.1 hypothetical protein SN03_04707 [Serratia marcescens]
MIFITRFMNSFLHQASFATGYWYYDRHRSVRLVILVGLAIDQIAQSGLSSLSVIYYSAQLFSIKTITNLSDTNCLEIQGASLSCYVNRSFLKSGAQQVILLLPFSCKVSVLSLPEPVMDIIGIIMSAGKASDQSSSTRQ